MISHGVDDRRRLSQHIPTLRRRGKTDELSVICVQIESEANIDAAVLEIYRKAKNTQNATVSIKPKIIGELQFPIEDVRDRKPEELQTINQTTLVDILKSGTISQPVGTTIKDEPLLNESLITDIHLFPRSEYYTRFAGTTVFAMNEPAYWGTYHRSESSRFFSIAGGRKNAQFSSACVKKAKGTHSFYAHTGGFHSLFTVSKYSDAFKLKKQVDEGIVNVRDQLLLYKNRMAKVVVESFVISAKKNEQKVKKKYAKKHHYIRPIVYVENDYPCVLVAFPVLNPMETQTGAAKYWQQHPKPFQRLLLCSFIAILNIGAMRANIPIEMVLRASFGHNLPSVCETNNTFRINVGVIPKCYAELIGKALHQLNQIINKITDETSPSATFAANFLTQVRVYNAKKLKKAITEKTRYKKLRGTLNFNNAEDSDVNFENLYKSFCEENQGKPRKGGASFIPVNLKNKTIWEIIRQAGDSMGKSVLDECFRQKGTEDWFANQVMEALLTDSTNPIETALSKLLNCITYNEKVTMNYKKIHDELNKPKISFTSLSFERFYEHDSDFSEVTSILFEGLCAERPNNSLYSELERAGTNFFITARGSQDIQEEPDYGSDSEFEDELTDKEIPKRSHISHRKLRVCAGMKAILLAQYGALSYFHTQGITHYRQDIQQMYYEVEDALKLVDVSQPVINKVRSTMESNILHFDLNHCNASNSADSQTLKEKLDVFNPSIVILDYTSTTTLSVKEALQQCFSKENVKLVMLVDSGLKNNQGGLDINPYGEVRICARNMEIVKTVSDMMRNGLSEQDKLMPKAHEKVRACKRRGMAFSLFGLFKTDKSRFQPIEEKQSSSPNPKL